MILKCVSSLAVCPNFCFAAKVETCLYSECNDFLYRGVQTRASLAAVSNVCFVSRLFLKTRHGFLRLQPV